MGTVSPAGAATVVDAIDVDGITEALDGAKEAIVEAIRAELHRQAPRPGQRPRFRLTPTRGMVEPLVALYERGRREARAELDRAGVALPRAFAVPVPERIRAPYLRLTVGLEGITSRAQRDLERTYQDLTLDDVNSLVRRRIDAALDRVPGLRSVAASLVSESFIAGTADLYEENLDAFGGFVATAILDANTCEDCLGKDGTTYPTPAAAAADGWKNGGWGPYEECDGRDRCRCRIVPIPSGATDRVVAGALPGEAPVESFRLTTPGVLRDDALTEAIVRAQAFTKPTRVAPGVFAYRGLRFRVERGIRAWRAVLEDGTPLTAWLRTRREVMAAAAEAIEASR